MTNIRTCLVEIRSAEWKTSKAGNKMFQCSMHDVDTGKFVCLDWIVLSDKARRFTEAKLDALGFEGKIGPTSGDKLRGLRAVVALREETYQGSKSWKVDGEAEGFDAGYLPAADWVDDPANKTANLAEELFDAGTDPDSVPF